MCVQDGVAGCVGDVVVVLASQEIEEASNINFARRVAFLPFWQSACFSFRARAIFRILRHVKEQDYHPREPKQSTNSVVDVFTALPLP